MQKRRGFERENFVDSCLLMSLELFLGRQNHFWFTWCHQYPNRKLHIEGNLQIPPYSLK